MYILFVIIVWLLFCYYSICFLLSYYLYLFCCLLLLLFNILLLFGEIDVILQLWQKERFMYMQNLCFRLFVWVLFSLSNFVKRSFKIALLLTVNTQQTKTPPPPPRERQTGMVQTLISEKRKNEKQKFQKSEIEKFGIVVLWLHVYIRVRV